MGATGLLFRGQRQRRAGQCDAAVETLARAAEAAPDSPHVMLHRALALADAARLDGALHLLAEGAERWPQNPVFPLFRAALLIENDRLDDAAAPLGAARELSPGNLLAEAYAALAEMRRGRIEEPLQQLAAAGMTDNARALAAILTEVEAELFRRFGADTDAPPPRAEELPQPDEPLRRKSAPRLAAAGTQALERGDAAKAYALLSLALHKNPSLPNVQTHLGCACFDLGRHEEALEHFDRVGDWAQMQDVLHLHRGACLYKLGRLDEALEALDAALKADELGEYATWIRFFQGRALIALGRRAEARDAFRRYVELEGDLALARLRQARELLGLAVPNSAPHGFEVIEEGKTTLVVRKSCAEAVRERRPADGAEPPPHGRAPLVQIALPDGVGLVRRCRRGGLLGGALRDVFLDGKRFLREVGVADALARRGVPTPQIVAGVRREVFPGIYRSEIVTRKVSGARDLAEALRSLPDDAGRPEALCRLFLAVARLLAQIHRAGLDHPDLNARNVLIAPDGTAMILDLDKAGLVDALPKRRRVATIARLYRSLHKLGLAPEPVSDDAWTVLLNAYASAVSGLQFDVDSLLERCRREVRRHRLWWKLTGQAR